MHYIVQGDTGSELTSYLVRQDDGSVVDCSDAVVLLKVKARNTTTPITEITGGGVNMATGYIEFLLTTVAALSPGYYEGEIQVTHNGSGYVESVFELIQFQIRAEF